MRMYYVEGYIMLWHCREDYDYRVDKRLNVGVDAFHCHSNALALARRRNLDAGFKVVKIVVVDHHFLIVDHTWERN